MTAGGGMKVAPSKGPLWHEAKLGEILPVKYGKARSEQFGYPRPQTATFGSNGAFGTFPRALTQGPSILVGRKGAAGTVHFSSEPCWPIDTTFYTEGNAGTFLPFFRYLLESLQLGQFDRSTAIPSLSRDDYDSRIIHYPESLPEQRRIVAEIEKQFTRLEAGVSALRRVQANLKRYRAAVLKAACEGDWPRKPLGEIAEVRLGKMLDKAKHVSGCKLPYLRNVNVRWGKTDTDDLREMYFKDNELERYGLKVGDVLVCEGGEPGRASVWSGQPPEMKYQKAIHRVRFKIPFDPRLLVWLLERLALTGGLERRFTGSTIKHFTREAFVELPIPLPPLAEQTRIVAEVERRLSVVEELEAVVTTNHQRATRLRQAILQKAFTGELG